MGAAEAAVASYIRAQDAVLLVYDVTDETCVRVYAVCVCVRVCVGGGVGLG
jgi:hypothetical protein